MVDDAVKGVTNGGTLGLGETAEGGGGGDGFGGAGGVAGSGTATLIFDDTQNATQSKSIDGVVLAEGANGGQGTTGDGASGAASTDVAITGTGTVATSATSEGGVGTQIGGNAQALASSAAPQANATANAIGGYGATQGGTGLAVASILGTAGSGATGRVSASAQSSLSGSETVVAVGASAVATVAVAPGSPDIASATAQTQIGGAQLSFAGPSSADAGVDGAPDATATHTVLTANHVIRAAFGTSPSFFSIGDLAGGGTATGVTVGSDSSGVSTEINLGNLSSPGDLEIGFFAGTASASGVTGVTLTVGNGFTSLLPTQTFASGAAAVQFFTDNPFDLGALASSGTLSVDIGLTVQTDSPGAFFSGEFILGDPPPAAATDLHAGAPATPLSPAAMAHGWFG